MIEVNTCHYYTIVGVVFLSLENRDSFEQLADRIDHLVNILYKVFIG
jgi:hypothetical protein